MTSRLVVAVCVLFAACAVSPRSAGSGGDPQEGRPPEGAAADAPGWTFDATALAYVLPDDRDYVAPVVTADRGALHLEARYAYEDRDTGSLWGGWNVELGDELRLDATLMAGWVFGNTRGVAPGYRFSLGYDIVELSSEAEYLFDLDDHDDSFFYSWSELSAAPVEWLRAGVAGQRTRVFGEDDVIDRGLLLEVASEGITVTGYVFEPFGGERYWVFAGGLGF